MDSKGCIGPSTGSADVIVNPMPVADFGVYPQPADVTNPVIHFIDIDCMHISLHQIVDGPISFFDS